MKNFKILKTKRMKLVELKDNHGGSVSFLVMIICLINLFFMSGSVSEFFFRFGVSFICALTNYFFYVIIFDEFDNIKSHRILRHLYVDTMILFIIYCDFYGRNIISDTEKIMSFLAGIVLGLLYMFLLVIILFIMFVCLLMLRKAYIAFISCFIYIKLPTSKEELEECGVRNRIDCVLYYLYMQKGFMGWKKHSIIYLNEFGKQFTLLTEILYSFPLSDKDYHELYAICKSDPQNKKPLNILSNIAPEHSSSYDRFETLSMLPYYLEYILNTGYPENKNNESILLHFKEIIDK